MLIGIFEEGLTYAILALGVYITYRILDFPDLSVDGTFPFGAVITASLITRGVNPLVAMLVSALGGAAAGLVTGLVHVKCRVRDLLSGIITMTALWSVNLITAGNVANIPISPTKDTTLFINNPVVERIPAVLQPWSKVLIILVIVIVAKLLLDAYLNTKSGYLLRAVGDNPAVVTTLAKDSGTVKIIGLVLANALVALAGSVMCQQQRYYDITMGTGAIVIGLASVIIGINLFRRLSFVKGTFAVIVGSIVYKACVGIAIRYVPDSSKYMKLMIAVFFLIILIIGDYTSRMRRKPREEVANA